MRRVSILVHLDRIAVKQGAPQVASDPSRRRAAQNLSVNIFIARHSTSCLFASYAALQHLGIANDLSARWCLLAHGDRMAGHSN